MGTERRADALVIGGGVNGLAAAWHLRRLGAGSVVLLERFAPGHDRGSSHGASRVTRSAYPSAVYVKLLAAANREEWPRLEREAGETLRRPTRACFFGPPGGLYDEFARTMAGFGEEVAFLSPAEASRRFPELRFDAAAGAIDDRTAGVVAAARTVRALDRLCRESGVEILDGRRVASLQTEGGVLRAVTDRESVVADRGVVAAGAWSADLLPFLRPLLTVIRQTVGYFRLETAGTGIDPDRFPIWAHLGASRNDFHYGLPRFERDGIKAARHVCQGPADDPEVRGDPPERALRELRGMLGTIFTVPPAETVGAETCLYTLTGDEDFLIDLHPGHAGVAFGAGFSGHGFKFAPLTGRILAELALSGRTTVPEFEESRETFSLDG